MKQYRKKPIVVEAIQYTGDNAQFIMGLLTSRIFEPIEIEDREDDEHTAQVWDKTHNVWIPVKDNEWIMKGAEGEFYPCDPTVFNKTYEEVK